MNYDPEDSYFGGLDWSAEHEAVQDAFTSLRNMWMYKMVNGWHSTVGFRLATSKPETISPSAPTFPPTSITYTTYPWIDPHTDQGDDKSTANALCYLVMTQNRSPSAATPLLPYTGTWVSTNPVTDPNRDAIFCMNASQFWSEWLLPQMQALNLGAHVQPPEPKFESTGFNGASIGLSFEAGWCSAHTEPSDAYFGFHQEKNKEGIPKPQWTWKSDDKLCHTHNELTNHSVKWTLNQDGEFLGWEEARP
jgi:hypothetical protein